MVDIVTPDVEPEESLDDRYEDRPVDEDSPWGTAVTVEDVGEEVVTLDLPDNRWDAPRWIPDELIELGSEANSWFAWDMREKQPRAPGKNSGFAGPCKWGRDSVSMTSRVGTTYADILDTLGGSVDGHIDDEWFWPDGSGELPDEDPRDLYPMCIVPHADCQPDDDPYMLVDLDDVIDPVTGGMPREVWDLIQDIDGWAEVSKSMTGVHMIIRARFPSDYEPDKFIEDLETIGQIELYGAPADGRVVGTTWMHIDETPTDTIPHAQDEVERIINEYGDDEDRLTEDEQVRKVTEQRKSDLQDNSSSSSKSPYYRLNPVPIANTGPFASYGSNGQGPHPAHGAESGSQWDSESTNFTVSRTDGWNCFAHGSGGGALQLIAVLEGIRDCKHSSDVMDDPTDAMRTCLAARDCYSSDLDDETPPTVALKGVAEVLGLDYPDEGKMSRSTYQACRSTWDTMEYTGGAD